MIFQAEWFSYAAFITAWPVLAALLAVCAKSAFKAFSAHRSAVNLVILIVTTAWLLNATPDDGQLAGMSYHLLAMNLAALMIGVPAAFWLGALLLFPYVWLFGGDWQVYPINALALLLPPLITNILFRRLVNLLPANLFIFIFVNGFIGSAASILFTGLVLVAVLDWAAAFPSDVLWSTALPVFILIAWAEAFLSGITTAIFVALRPQWINTFDDNRYLKPTNQIW
ncbi:energy-coupling factor ABC transporter permease [Neisseria yangbaofengii]|uniref:energy-coupling factor ABC transporter permease n=1 Tax=Neisseria yangbaofengii TaxID=2709396 RepID=UPI0013ECAC74|nr:energy-coupling factor ABC transporter permease [Neisseria yangbaofengii]